MSYIITENCIRCGCCEHVCYFYAIALNPGDDIYTIDQEKCVHCGECFDTCAVEAIVSADSDKKRITRVGIIADNCTACSLCKRKCPVNAISGQPKEPPFILDTGKCIHCGICFESCRFEAIEVEYA